jgi:hypothetical protein
LKTCRANLTAFESAKYVLCEQLLYHLKADSAVFATFQKQATANLVGLQKVSANSEAFGAKW